VAEIYFTFEPHKAIEAILYLAQRIADPTFHSINKLMYFADKTSLERYGRFISGDDYYAMQWGPIPTRTYDLMKSATASAEFPFAVEGYSVVPTRDAAMDLFSESDIESLDESIQLYGHVPFWKRNQDSHDEAWRQAWGSRGTSGSVRIPIESIASLLQESDDLIEYLSSRGAD
jgi:uncharacterized phage-associated protein